MEEDDLLPISALEHLLYCERQCALIHVEGQWAENRFTAEGHDLHRRVDEGDRESRPGVELVRSVRVASRVLGVRGVIDAVELVRSTGELVARPIEYKRGARRRWAHDEVQLCAEA